MKFNIQGHLDANNMTLHNKRVIDPNFMTETFEFRKISWTAVIWNNYFVDK